MPGDIVEADRRIVALDAACRALAEARTVQDAKAIRDQAEAFRHYARERDLGEQAILDASEIKVRAERRMGELLAEMRDRGEFGRGNKCCTVQHLGITRDDSMRCQRIRSIPEDVFERHVTEQRADETDRPDRRLTTAGLVRLANELNKPPGPRADGFNSLRERDVIEAWLWKRYRGFPPEFRDEFIGFLRSIVDVMEDAIHAGRGGGAEIAEGGEGGA